MIVYAYLQIIRSAEAKPLDEDGKKRAKKALDKVIFGEAITNKNGKDIFEEELGRFIIDRYDIVMLLEVCTEYYFFFPIQSN